MASVAAPTSHIMKRLSFFGYGKTTRAIARVLGGGFDFFDDRFERPFVDDGGNRIHPSADFDPSASALEILTPSIRPNSPLLQAASFPLSEYDLFLSDRWIERLDPSIRRTLPAALFALPRKRRTVWISGTNGKTTTTGMITHLLSSRGAQSGGNIGTPLADLDPQSPLWILETSSFTLHHTRFASPDVYVLLPITPDHIDWHGSEEAYTADKLSPLVRMKEGEAALIPAALTPPHTPAWVIPYREVSELGQRFGFDPDALRYKGAFLEDAALALSVSRILFDDADTEALNRFGLEPHRQQEIVDAKGRLWVNDSKATNLDAALKAIETYRDRPIHLIAGGDDKGVDMEPLIRRLAQTGATLYAIGSNDRRLEALAKAHGVPVYAFATLDEALRALEPRLKAGEVALLSPAASSLDQYPSYAKRGEEFLDFVRRIPEN